MTELLWVVVGIAIGAGLVAGRRWTSLDAARFEADANWERYVESERKRCTATHDLAEAQIQVNVLQGERDLAAFQLTQLAAVAQVATQQAQSGRAFSINENPLARICPN